MIKFHYHRAPRDLPRLGLEKGALMCHVYSDIGVDELAHWGQQRGLKTEWIHNSSIPHFDTFGKYLDVCGEGVTRRQLVVDIRRWRNGRS